ncbi:MAG: DUF6631 family protein [Burkholderiaceae bacterium]
MARKIVRPAQPRTAEPPAPDLVVLHPEHEFVLGGQTVVVREYGNLEWLRLLPAVEPLVAVIAEQLEAEGTSYESTLMVIASHADTLLPIVAQAIDRDLAFIESIKSDEVETLLMVWWGVNSHFFVGRAINRVQVRRHEALAIARLTGARSTPSSSLMATDETSSAATPPAS